MQTQSALIILCVAATLSTPSYAQRAAKSKLEQLEQQQKEIQREIAMLQAVSENQNSSSVKQAEKNPKLVASQLNELRPEIRVFSLKYTQAAQVSDVMRAIHNDTSNTRFAVDSRTNRLIVHAPPRIHDQVVSVLAEIDRKPDSAKSRSFRIRNSEAARQIANHLDRLNLSSVRWTSDHLQVSAESMSELDQAEKLIREIEETARPQSRTIRIVWLATKNGESGETPEDIKPILRELQQLGVPNMAVGAQVSIRTTGDFETSCITKNGYKLKASGMYRDKSIDVQLQLSLENKDVISIVTSIDAPLGHPVVLGMSPMQVGNSAFVIVVE